MDLWNTKKLSERKFWFLKDASAEQLTDIDMFSTDITLDDIERGEQVSINWESSSGVFYCKRNMMESICCFEFLMLYM